VSLRHAELDWDPTTTTFFLSDLGSTSGTLRNGEPIEGRVALDHGDVIAVGKTELRFKRSEVAPAEKPPLPPPTPPPEVIVESTERLPERTTPGQKAAWKKWKAAQAAEEAKAAKAGKPINHDTIALVALMPDGNLFGGCSTSGWGYKIPGRVGDSPIIGSGLYVDNEVGAAGATGIGENVMRYCGSFLVVEYMRQGLHPQEACIETIRRIARMDPKGYDLAINFVAIDRKGRFGAAGTGTGFQYSATSRTFSKVLQSPGLTAADVGPVGGNRK
jgi:hypothetical protein